MNADVLVTGHNLDDEAQNVLMNFLKGNIFLGVNSSPATGDRNTDGFVQRVKPLFFIAENDIRTYAKSKKFDILYDKCPCSFETYRSDTREWLESINDKEKLAIVKNFQKLTPGLRTKNIGKIKKCPECGEPSRSNICNACKIFAHLK